MTYKVIATVVALMAFGGGRAAAQACPFDPIQALPRAVREATDDSIGKLPRRQRVFFTVAATRAAVAEQLKGDFVTCGLPAPTVEPGMLTSRLPRASGSLGFGEYSIIVSAELTQAGDSTLVALTANEWEYVDIYENRNGQRTKVREDSSVSLVTNKGRGRAYKVWRAMLAMRSHVQTEPVLASMRASRAVEAPPAPAAPAAPAFIGFASRKIYVLGTCSLVNSIPELERVSFSSEGDAKAAGFLRSGAPGC